MLTFSIDDAEAQLSALVDRVAGGEEIIITKGGRPVTKLTSLSAGDTRPKRVLGSLAGRVVIPEDFDAPLPDEVLDAFEGRSNRP
jgi:prevent-host-death family protein